MKRRRRRALFVAMTLGVAVTVTGVAMESSAQNRGGRGTVQHKPPKAADAAAASSEPGSDGGSSMPSNAPAQGVLGVGPMAEVKGVDAGAVEVRKVGDGGQAMRFSELDIEGRLRSPQLIYFLRRVRAEFASGDLGHRTFMRELSETRKDPSF